MTITDELLAIKAASKRKDELLFSLIFCQYTNDEQRTFDTIDLQMMKEVISEQVDFVEYLLNTEPTLLN